MPVLVVARFVAALVVVSKKKRSVSVTDITKSMRLKPLAIVRNTREPRCANKIKVNAVKEKTHQLQFEAC